MAKMINYGGATACEHENYETRINMENGLHKSGIPKWLHPIINLFLVPIFSFMDGLVLFSVFDACFTQTQSMGIIMAAGIALVLNTLPLIIARFLHQAIYKTKKHAWAFFGVVTLGFTLLFSTTVYLRYSFADTYNPSNQNVLFINNDTYSGSNEEVDEETEKLNETKSYAVVALLSVSPLMTSLISFAIAFMTDDEVKSEFQYLEIQSLKFEEGISELKGALYEIENTMNTQLEEDERLLYAACDEIHSQKDVLKAQARLYLAEYLKNPNATSKLSNELLVEKEENKYEKSTF